MTIAVVALFLVVLILVTLVLFSGNLRPVIERAKRDGLPTTWAELGLKPGNQRVLDRIQALVIATKSYGYPSIQIGGAYYTIGTPGIELPEGLRAHVAKRGEGVRRDIRECILAMQEPVRPAADPGPEEWSRSEFLSQFHRLAREELLVTTEPAESDVLALLLACEGIPPDSLLHLVYRVEAMREACRVIRYHLPRLAGRSPALAARLRQEAVELAGLLPRVTKAEFARMATALSAEPERYLKSTGQALPVIMDSPSRLRIVHRLGRVPLVERERSWAVSVMASTDPRGPAPAAPPTLPKDWNRIPEIVLGIVFSNDPRHGYWHREYPRLHTNLLVTAAALDGAPWPVDPWSPSRSLLKEVADGDGRVLAVYGLGENGVDDGGKRGDEVYPLYGPINPMLPRPSP